MHLSQSYFCMLPEQEGSSFIDTQINKIAKKEVVEDKRIFLLHQILSPKECQKLIAYGESVGFPHAGLAIGDDTYRRQDRVRNNFRVIFESHELAKALWERISQQVEPIHENSYIVGLNWRFRLYKYEVDNYFAPHYDIRTKLSNGETRYSFVLYLNDRFEGGSTTFFSRKEKRRGEHRKRKYNNPIAHVVRPSVGSAVVFDHLLLHEGTVVSQGTKYAIRSDLIYDHKRLHK